MLRGLTFAGLLAVFARALGDVVRQHSAQTALFMVYPYALNFAVFGFSTVPRIRWHPGRFAGLSGAESEFTADAVSQILFGAAEMGYAAPSSPPR